MADTAIGHQLQASPNVPYGKCLARVEHAGVICRLEQAGQAQPNACIDAVSHLVRVALGIVAPDVVQAHEFVRPRQSSAWSSVCLWRSVRGGRWRVGALACQLELPHTRRCRNAEAHSILGTRCGVALTLHAHTSALRCERRRTPRIQMPSQPAMPSAGSLCGVSFMLRRAPRF
eukprot:32725-Chlamydomonas_euryale.AAC.12